MGCGKSKPSKHGSEGDGKPTWKPNACFIGNLVGWLVFGVLLSGWLLRYTDHFKFFGGLLALGGLFSWLAFVFKVIPDDRLGVLQEEFCKVVFDEPRALAVPAAGTLIVGLLFFSLGTVEVGNTQSTVAAVYFTKTAERPADEESPLTAVSVPPGKHVRFVRWAPVFSHTSYTVKSPGFPRQTVAIGGFTRKVDLQLPSSFYQPIVLVGVDDFHVKGVQTAEYVLEITVDETTYLVRDEQGNEQFLGNTVLLGCDPDPDLLMWPHVLSYWPNISDPTVRNRVLQPVSLSEVRQVKPGSKVSAKLIPVGGGAEFEAGPLVVRPVRRPSDMLQVLYISDRANDP